MRESAVLKKCNSFWIYYKVIQLTSSMVNHSERKCNVQEPQVSLIAHNHNSISILLQGILLVVISSFYEAVLRGVLF
jgi:hypothetical protein